MKRMSREMHGTGHPLEKLLKDAISAEENLRKPFLDRLEMLYADMDDRYREVAARYGFHCRGCEDNCCRTTFYHHTVVEYLFLEAGFRALDKNIRTAAVRQAKRVAARPSEGLFCPLCMDDRCLLYTYRPMICRLHGIAHEFRRPNGAVNYGPGCAAFEAAADGKPYIAFDRTVFYLELSRLEHGIRSALEITEKLKKTVSQMVIEF